MSDTKEPIKLRQRKMPSGNTTLYLDIYINGTRSYEYLKLYIVPELTRADREKNKETLRLADAIRSKRVVELRNGVYGFNNAFSTKTRFYDYYLAMVEKRHGEESKGNWGNWRSCYHHLKIYDGRETLTFADITPEWVQGFKDYLEHKAVAWQHDFRKRAKDKPLSRNSKVSYFNKLRACLNQAFEERIIPYNPLRGIEGFKAEEGTRMYLTIDEVKRLVQAECEYPQIKAAFLFSCLTGLRRSDVLRITWGDVYEQGEFTRLIFKQKKTKGQEYLDITGEARALMGERGKPNEHPFEDIHSPSCTNRAIQEWVLRAGIDKKITFHCARHTFATMMLDIGTDLYVVSKLLGHREIHTTQIYARVMDKNKQAAVAAIPSILSVAEELKDDNGD